MRDGRETIFGQKVRHHGKYAAHVLHVPAQVPGPVKIDEKELSGVMKARICQKVLMRTRKTRRLPAAQERPPLGQTWVLTEPGAQRR